MPLCVNFHEIFNSSVVLVVYSRNMFHMELISLSSGICVSPSIMLCLFCFEAHGSKYYWNKQDKGMTSH